LHAGCALIGGETAEMPGFYPEDEFDLAGFSVGIVDKENIFDSSAIQEGDVIIALPSSGVHSNGFSLVRKIIADTKADLFASFPACGKSLGETLLTPTRIYVKMLLALSQQVSVKAVSHITGGGLYENIPRALPEGFSAKIEEKSLKTLPVFDWIQKIGKVDKRDMYNTFNMGVGMSLVVDKQDADRALSLLGEGYIMGEAVKSDQGVILC
ncbi:MAG TPA: phosphoribosylformylglycinamidine cyclo-ligase, partial [Clostridiales bacterium]|nr:phosphoribosylformylglycinamidine cyclo-ligase [Clostridiales bacterium]